MAEDGMGPWEVHLRLARAPRNTPTDLAEAVRRHEDEMAIRDLLVRYTYFHDANNADATADLHHKDCILHVPSGTKVGLEAIRAYWRAGAANKRARDWKHYITNILVRFNNADEAVASSFFMWTHTLERPDSSTAAAVGGGWYVDVVGRFGDQWLFKERTINRGFDFLIPGVAGFGALQIGRESMHGDASPRS